MSEGLLIFDCDGVLADTERDGHLVAFNQMFDELGIPLHWSDDEYAKLVHIGGGKERLASVVTPAVRERLRLPAHDEELRMVLARWHQVKTRRYKELVASGALPGRPGVKRLIAEALRTGWMVAVASTSAHESVVAVLQQVVGEELAEQVHVYAGDIVPHKKPASDIYRYALDALEFEPQDAVVIEDSGIGCQAATAADIATIVTVSSYTKDDDFTGASLVLSDLGEPGRPVTVLANSARVPVPEFVNVATLDAVREQRS